MPRIILHRGLWRGPDSDIENNPSHIAKIVNKYDCEIDLWKIKNQLYLGHDKPQYRIDFDFLVDLKHKLWIHAKNSQALDFLCDTMISLKYFWHEQDKHALVSSGHIWQAFHYDGLTNKTIVVDSSKNPLYNAQCWGLCIDYIK